MERGREVYNMYNVHSYISCSKSIREDERDREHKRERNPARRIGKSGARPLLGEYNTIDESEREGRKGSTSNLVSSFLNVPTYNIARKIATAK